MNYLNLFLFAVTALFSNGRWIAPIAFWISPFFMQRYLRRSGLLIGAATTLIADFIVTAVCWWGIIPVEGVLYYSIALGMSVANLWLPFYLDRLLYRKVPGFLSTLVLPVAFTLIEFAYAMLNPFGAMSGLGVTQTAHTALAQIASVTGRWGISFLVMWFPSTLNWIFENGVNRRRSVMGATIFGGVLLGVLLYGDFRLHIIKDRTATVRVAGISPSHAETRWDDPNFWTFYDKVLKKEPIESAELARVKSLEGSIAEELRKLTTSEAAAGSKIIVWAETSLLLLEEEEGNFTEEYRMLALNRGIYLVAPVMVVRQGTDEPFENMAYLFKPDGTMNSYTKTMITPGDEQRRGDGSVFTAQTPYGILSVILCNDQSYPAYVRKLRGVDILAIPSDVWEAMDPYFTRFAGLYSIEYGFNIVLPAIQGVSASFDGKGRMISQADYFTASPKVLVAQVPVSGILTPYAVLGDWFIYACLAGAAALFFAALTGRKESFPNKGTV